MEAECKHCYQNSGWQYPNLGVNCPAGCVWALASSSALGRFPWIPCQSCNKDRKKPTPIVERKPVSESLPEFLRYLYGYSRPLPKT